MANFKNIATAFLDGFAALGSIFEPTERPGSRDNLMRPAFSLAPTGYFSTEAVLRRSDNVQEIVGRLRENANAIERRNALLHQAVAKDSGAAHGLR